MGIFVYHFWQWLLFFFFYGFCGWVWESSYVSLKKRKWTNRGFMYGPIVPIYGCGAVIMLMATLSFKEHMVLVFIFGMIAASILEYVTGAMMERLFGVRYWDYSQKKFNINGHICLGCSLAWGVFSVLLVKFVHEPIEHFLFQFPSTVLISVVIVVAVVFVIDFSASVKAALDIKAVLRSITQNNEELQRIQKRLDVLVAVIDEETTELKEKVSYDFDLLSERREQLKEAKEDMQIALRRERREKIGALLNRLDQMKEARIFAREQGAEVFRSELDEIREKMATLADERYEKAKAYRSAKLVLKRNNAVSEIYNDAMKELKDDDIRDIINKQKEKKQAKKQAK